MKKKILVSSVVAMVAVSTMKANPNIELLTGDTKLACEAILCLSSPARPSECSPSLARYFGISFKKAWKTAQARRDFLNLCPESSMTPEMKDQVADLSQLTGLCTLDELNANIEKQYAGTANNSNNFPIKLYNYRVSPEMTHNCKIVTRLNYNDYAFKYTCSKDFYNQTDWTNGFTKEYISQSAFMMLAENLRGQDRKLVRISQSEYYKLPSNERTMKKVTEGGGDGGSYTYYIYYKIEPLYYKKHFIKKDCWVDARK